MKAVYLLLAISFYFLCSCQNQDEVESYANNYTLELVDSVQIELMSANLILHDVHDESGNLLMFQTSPPIVFTISPKGEILKKFEMPLEGPSSVGSNLMSVEFFNDGYALMGQREVKVYDEAFNVLGSHRIKINSNGSIYRGHNHLMEAEIDGRKYLTTYFSSQTEFSPVQAEFYQNLTILDLLDAESGEYMTLGKLEEGSHLLNERAHYFIKPVFHTVNDKVYYAMNNDTSLFIMGLPEGNNISRKRIPFDKFVLSEGYSLGMSGIEEQNKPEPVPGRIHSVFHFEPFDFIEYSSGMSLQELNDAQGANQQETFANRRRINPRKYLIMKDGNLVSDYLRIPEKINQLSVADKQGNIWATQNINVLDSEPELITFYKLRIQPR